MKILVLNCGSSSIKYKLYDMTDHSVMAQGGIEKIGLPGSFLKMTLPDGTKKIIEEDIPEHTKGVQFIFHILTDPELGALKSLEELGAVGHRMVHGGEKFNQSVLLTPEVLEAFTACNDLAPLHNPANLKGVNAVSALLPSIPQVGVFDTAFHQTMPDYAYMYALPYEMYEKYGIRRYGFHGTSHRYVSQRVCEYLGVDPADKRIITCHVGNGGSISAVKDGKCIDTSMGLTPLEGLMMGTRSGDVDGGAVTFIMDKEGLAPSEMSNLLNKKIRRGRCHGSFFGHARGDCRSPRRQPTLPLGSRHVRLPREKIYRCLRCGHERGGHHPLHRRRGRKPGRHARSFLQRSGLSGRIARQSQKQYRTWRRSHHLHTRQQSDGMRHPDR